MACLELIILKIWIKRAFSVKDVNSRTFHDPTLKFQGLF